MTKTQLSVTELEPRTLLDASVSLANGLLSVLADNKGDYIIVQQPTPQTVEVLVASEQGKTYDFPAANVNSIAFQGGFGNGGDYFANNTALPSTQKAGGNHGLNYLQGGSGNDTLVASTDKKASTYETDAGGTNTFVGGPGFVNMFAGKGTDTFTLGSGYTALYSILAKGTITGRSAGKGYLIVNAGSSIANAANYQIITFFQPGVSGTAPGNPGGPAAIVKADANGNNILYLDQASAQSSTSFRVDPAYDGQDGIAVTYTDSSGKNLHWVFHNIAWIGSFGPSGSNNTIINTTAVNDVFYGGLPPGNHTIIGGTGINVLKGHSGTNSITANGYYNDVTAGSGTDNVQLNFDYEALADARAKAGIPVEDLGVVRTNQAKVTTTISAYQIGYLVVGVPKQLNGVTDPNPFVPATEAPDIVADNDDYAYWASLLPF